ncbi:MAG: enoyl-CoA hydratase [Pseudomonadota bacterium]
MSYETLIVTVEDHVMTIQMNRPKAKNALNMQMTAEIAACIRDAEGNEKIGAIVLTGNEDAFAAGADIKEMADQSFVDMFLTDFKNDDHEAITKCRKPIIAAVAGYALGGGCEIAMMCDIIFAADTAKFGQPEINLGIPAGIGGTQRLTRAIGKSKAMDMHLTGRFMDAEEAERSGLVSRVVPAKRLMKEAQEAAAKIAQKSPIAVLAIKEAVNRSFETTLEEGVLFERRIFQALFSTEDQSEGMQAFVEKREPQFRGR